MSVDNALTSVESMHTRGLLPCQADVLHHRGRDAGARDDRAAAQARPALLQVRVERVQGQGRARVLQQPVPGLREVGVQGAEQQAAGQDLCGRVAIAFCE